MKPTVTTPSRFLITAKHAGWTLVLIIVTAGQGTGSARDVARISTPIGMRAAEEDHQVVVDRACAALSSSRVPGV